jgi:hypothetical protein
MAVDIDEADGPEPSELGLDIEQLVQGISTVA